MGVNFYFDNTFLSTTIYCLDKSGWILWLIKFLSDPGVLGSDLWVGFVCPSLSERRCANLTDVTLADQATKSIPTDVANMEIQGNVAMKVTQPGG